MRRCSLISEHTIRIPYSIFGPKRILAPKDLDFSKSLEIDHIGCHDAMQFLLQYYKRDAYASSWMCISRKHLVRAFYRSHKKYPDLLFCMGLEEAIDRNLICVFRTIHGEFLTLTDMCMQLLQKDLDTHPLSKSVPETKIKKPSSSRTRVTFD